MMTKRKDKVKKTMFVLSRHAPCLSPPALHPVSQLPHVSRTFSPVSPRSVSLSGAASAPGPPVPRPAPGPPVPRPAPGPPVPRPAPLAASPAASSFGRQSRGQLLGPPVAPRPAPWAASPAASSWAASRDSFFCFVWDLRCCFCGTSGSRPWGRGYC